MRRSFIIVAIALSVAASAAAATYPTTVKIDAAAKKQPPVVFNHANHGDKLVKTCDVCHHTQKGLKKEQVAKTEVKKCGSCHLDPKGKETSMREMNLAKNPFHLVCIKCHKEQKKGPAACTGCHKKGA